MSQFCLCFFSARGGTRQRGSGRAAGHVRSLLVASVLRQASQMRAGTLLPTPLPLVLHTEGAGGSVPAVPFAVAVWPGVSCASPRAHQHPLALVPLPLALFLPSLWFRI